MEVIVVLIAVIIVIGTPIAVIAILIPVLIRSFKLLKIRIKNVDKKIEAYEREEKSNKKNKDKKPTQYETGWTWNEKTQLWEPPGFQGSNEATQPNAQTEANTDEIDYRHAYQSRQLFTQNEWQNYKKLRDIAQVKGYVICPKVRLLDIIEPRRGEKKYKTLFYKIQAKHVDFVICDQDMHIKAIIELDDNSHDRQDRKKRDEFVDMILRSVGYKVIHTRYITNDILDLV